MPKTAAEELLWQIFSPEEAKKRLKDWQQLPVQPELVRASELMHGDYFKELSDSRKDKPARVKELQGPCRMEPNNLHVKTSRGDWCIARDQFVVLVP